MTSQCPRCLSSFFTRLSNGRCTFCVGHWVSTAGGPYFKSVTLQFDRHEEPTVRNGRDHTTSGAIGQP